MGRAKWPTANLNNYFSAIVCLIDLKPSCISKFVCCLEVIKKITRRTPGARRCYFLTSNIKQVSNKFKQAVLGYRAILGYFGLSWAILGNFGESQAISGNIWQSRAISCYLMLFCNVLVYLRLSWTTSDYLELSWTILGYLQLSQAI